MEWGVRLMTEGVEDTDVGGIVHIVRGGGRGEGGFVIPKFLESGRRAVFTS